MLKYINMKLMLGLYCAMLATFVDVNPQYVQGSVGVSGTLGNNDGTIVLTCGCLQQLQKWISSLSAGGSGSVSIGYGGSGGYSGYGGNVGGSFGGSIGGDTSFTSSLSLALKGMGCVDDNVSGDPVDSDDMGNSNGSDPVDLGDADNDDATDQGSIGGDADDSIDSQDDMNVGVQYIVDINRENIFCPDNQFVIAPTVGNGDTTIQYYKGMSINAALMMYQAAIVINVTSEGQSEKINFYDSKPNKLIENVCESYPPRSIEANIIKILDQSIMNGGGCPIAEGTIYPVPGSLRGVTLVFDEPLPCGYYELNTNMDDPDGNWALWIFYYFSLSQDIHNCT